MTNICTCDPGVGLPMMCPVHGISRSPNAPIHYTPDQVRAAIAYYKAVIAEVRTVVEDREPRHDEVLVAEVERLRAENAELREVCEAWGRTADGAWVKRGMKLYPLEPVDCLGEDDRGEDYAVTHLMAREDLTYDQIVEGEGLVVSTCYSTFDAAEAARAALAERDAAKGGE